MYVVTGLLLLDHDQISRAVKTAHFVQASPDEMNNCTKNFVKSVNDELNTSFDGVLTPTEVGVYSRSYSAGRAHTA